MLGVTHAAPELCGATPATLEDSLQLSRSSLDALHAALHPRTVAVAGVSTTGRSWFGGGMFVNGMRHLGRVERIYALNPKGGSFDDGTPIYADLSDVPDEVDLLDLRRAGSSDLWT